jgi:hypothetical protein
MKKWPHERGAPLKRDKFVVFYYLNASEISPDKRGGFGGRGTGFTINN